MPPVGAYVRALSVIRERTTASPVGPVVRALIDPFAPEQLGRLQGVLGLREVRRLVVRGLPADGEGHPVTGADGEVGVGGQVLAVRVRLGVQPDRVRSGDGDRAVVDLVHPRGHPAVAETHPQLRAHRHPAADALHDADELRGAVTRGHEIGHPYGAARGVPLRLQDEGVAAIPPPVGPGRFCSFRSRGAQAPEAVLLGAQQARENGVGIEAGKAQPVRCAVPADQGGGLHVSDECVILDAPGHVYLQSNGHVALSQGTYCGSRGS